MAITDPIADSLTVIRNASSAKKRVVEVKHSGITEGIVEIFKKEGFISNYKIIKGSGQGLIRIYLKYGREDRPCITGIKRISKPSLRIYRPLEGVPVVCGGLGVAVISTSKGLMTDKEARDAGVGGEVICYAW